MASEFISVYIMAADKPEAVKIAQALVSDRLAACVNILPGVRSIYRWKSKIETAEEIALIAKTRSDLFDKLEQRVKELHSYSCPCVVAWPIESGSRAYLDWIRAETAP